MDSTSPLHEQGQGQQVDKSPQSGTETLITQRSCHPSLAYQSNGPKDRKPEKGLTGLQERRNCFVPADLAESVIQGGRRIPGLGSQHPFAWVLNQLLPCPEGRTLSPRSPSMGRSLVNVMYQKVPWTGIQGAWVPPLLLYHPSSMALDKSFPLFGVLYLYVYNK